MSSTSRVSWDEAPLSDHPLLKGFEFHEELESTNDLGLELAKSVDLPCPYLIQAARQTRGRGRGEHRWWSSAGAITCSLILDSEQLSPSPEEWPLISLVTGIGLAEALQPYLTSSPIRVKWPNDLYVADRKLGGILIETVRGESLRFVVGFGINLNNRVGDLGAGFLPQPQSPSGGIDTPTTFPTPPSPAPTFPDTTFSDINFSDIRAFQQLPPGEVAQRAISLVELLGRELPPRKVLWSVLSSLGRHYRDLAASRYPLLERWPRYCFLTGRSIRIRTGERLLSGICQGIDSRGGLTLATATGPRTCFAGEVQWDVDGEHGDYGERGEHGEHGD